MSENQIEIIGNREVELLEKQRKVNLQKLFTPEGMDAIIGTIKKEVADFKADVSTKEGRAKIVSMEDERLVNTLLAIWDKTGGKK